MALSWSLERIKDYEDLCFVTATQDDEFSGVTAGDRILNPRTNGLIWMTLFVGMPGITEDNVEEFWARTSTFEKWDHPTIYHIEEIDGKQERVFDPYTREDIEAHIGLATNVTFENRSAWLNRQFDINHPKARGKGTKARQRRVHA